MTKFQFPYEILKLKDEPLKEGEINYARFIQDNFDIIELYLNKKLLGEEWTDWTPTYSCTENMTYTSVTTHMAEYAVIDKMCFFRINSNGITGGTASYGIYFTLPITSFDYFSGGACQIRDGTVFSGIWNIELTNKDMILIQRYDTSNWSLGTNRAIEAQGFYRIK